jgi:hypothetical protein
MPDLVSLLIEAAVAPEDKSKANRIFGDDNGNDK